MPQGGLVVLHGKRGIGKSQFSLTLAHSVANGLDLFNHFEVKQGRVLLVQIDMTPQITKLRIEKLWGDYSLDNLYWWLDNYLDVQELNREHPLVKAIIELDPKLVVWDTLRKIHRLKENASESSQIVYGTIRRYLPKPTHLFIHHDKKTQIDKDGQLDPEEAFRGSTDWIDSVDTSIQIQETRPGRLNMHIHKCRTMAEEERPNISLEMDYKTLFLLPHGTVKGVRELIKEFKGQGVTDHELVITELIRRGMCTRTTAESQIQHHL